MTIDSLRGCGTALVTPFAADGVDLDGLNVAKVTKVGAFDNMTDANPRIADAAPWVSSAHDTGTADAIVQAPLLAVKGRHEVADPEDQTT